MKEKLDFDTDFLDGASPKKGGGVTHLPGKTGESNEWKAGASILGALIVAGLVIWAATSVSGSNEGSVSTIKSASAPFVAHTNTTNTDPSGGSALQKYKINEDAVQPVSKTSTSDKSCKDTFGAQAFATSEKNADGSPVCGCNAGYTRNDALTTCVAIPKVQTPLEICQSQNGPHTTYDGSTNSCGCASGYSLSAETNQCVDVLTARDDSCAATYPGTSFLKYDTTAGKNICDCKAGYYWNNDRTACYTAASFNQSCTASYGTGAYSTTQDSKRVCDCTYGYDWNIDRTSCVTTASINAMCERDVGRNSTYSGRVENGKYQCSQPY